MGALNDIRVLELGEGLSTAYCGRQFALWGAEVAVAEPPEGSPLRRRQPVVQTDGGPVSLLWEYVAAGKRSVARADAEALIAAADVVLLDGEGRSAADLHARFPHLVVVELSAFGRDGPFRELLASDLVVQALSGYVSLNGQPDRPPLKAPGHILAYACGVSAFVAALAGLVKRLKQGAGSLVEASEFDTVASILPLLRGQYTGVHPVRSGGPGTGVRLLACADGFVNFMPPTPGQLGEFERVLGVPPDAWPDSARDGRRKGRPAELMAFLTDYTRRLPAQDVFLGLLREGVPCGHAQTPEDLVAEPHLRARGFFHDADHPRVGPVAMPGAPARLSRTPAEPLPPAPDAAAGVTWTPRAPEGSSTADPPLAGVQLLDLTQAWIGPYAAMLLADLGAEVIKIESHRRPDVWRQWSANPVPLTDVRADEINASPNYNSVNCNKRSLCLDFKSEAGREIFRRLVRDADLVMENYTPRVLERLGLDYPTLREANPALVMASFCGFGKTGPLSDWKANGTTIEAIAGWDHFHRYPDGAPMVMGFYQADAITGLQMAATTLVALIHRLRTGEGQAVDGSMYEAAAGYIGEALLEAQLGGVRTPFGNRDADGAPHGVFPAVGDDAWVAISVLDDAQWAALARLAPELDEPRFATAAGRLAEQDGLEIRLAAWTSQLEADDAARRLQAVGVPAARVRSMAEVLACPHLTERGWFRRLAHADVGEHSYNGLPWRFAGVAPTAHRPSPRLGEHGREILKDRLGLSDAEIDALERADVTGAVLTKPKEPELTGSP